jgi:23S rRNA pseudouridine2457 synthase
MRGILAILAIDSPMWRLSVPLRRTLDRLHCTLRRLLVALTASLRGWWPRQLTTSRHRYYVLFKPCTVLCSFESDTARAAVKGRTPRTTLGDLELPIGVHHVGRLDRDSEGLLLLTDDGHFTHEVLHGRRHPKRYWALVTGHPEAEALEAMARGGLHIRGRETKPASVRRLTRSELPALPPHCSDGQEPSTWLEVILHEGMNRQVRRMTKHAGHYTIRLVRAGVGRLRLEDLGLRPGECRPIAASDVV